MALSITEGTTTTTPYIVVFEGTTTTTPYIVVLSITEGTTTTTPYIVALLITEGTAIKAKAEEEEVVRKTRRESRRRSRSKNKKSNIRHSIHSSSIIFNLTTKHKSILVSLEDTEGNTAAPPNIVALLITEGTTIAT